MTGKGAQLTVYAGLADAMGKREFVVVQTVNTTEFLPGQRLSKAELDDEIVAGTTVKIVERKVK